MLLISVSILLPLWGVSHHASADDGLYTIIYLCWTLFPTPAHPWSHPPQKTDALWNKSGKLHPKGSPLSLHTGTAAHQVGQGQAPALAHRALDRAWSSQKPGWKMSLPSPSYHKNSPWYIPWPSATRSPPLAAQSSAASGNKHSASGMGRCRQTACSHAGGPRAARCHCCPQGEQPGQSWHCRLQGEQGASRGHWVGFPMWNPLPAGMDSLQTFPMQHQILLSLLTSLIARLWFHGPKSRTQELVVRKELILPRRQQEKKVPLRERNSFLSTDTQLSPC